MMNVLDWINTHLAGDWLRVVAVLGLLLVVVMALIREWASPDIVAMSAFCVLIMTGLLSMDRAYSLFSNPAPITIAAMFILSAALEQTGVIDGLGHVLAKIVSGHLWITLPILMMVVASCSAFMNNTPIVAVFMPVVLAISRRKHLPASKMLIPLSYAAVLGGCCTLIGTSTNLVVNGIAVEYHQPALRMFEFLPLGTILLGVGVVYVTICGPWLLPDRHSLASILSADERKQFLCHVLIKPQSPLVGRVLTETELGDRRLGFRILEVRRGGSRLTLPLDQVVVSAYDRVLIAVSSKQMEKPSSGVENLKGEWLAGLGIENLSTIKGAIIEGIVAPHSRLIGKTLRSARFRQTHGMIVLGLHRGAKNQTAAFHEEELEFGDTLLLLGPVSTFAQLREEGDFMLLEDRVPMRADRRRAWIAVLALGGVVAMTAFDWVPIVFASTVACLAVLWLRCLSPQEAYKSIDWTVIFMLYGMLAVGEVMETSGAAALVSNALVAAAKAWVPLAYRRYVFLSLFYMMGSALTEVLSNNAVALVLGPIAINCAHNLGLDPRPFIFAVAYSASACFSTPIGYQTNMMVYAAGGYRFSDFVRFGLPLNILQWAAASYFIPLFWPFNP